MTIKERIINLIGRAPKPVTVNAGAGQVRDTFSTFNTLLNGYEPLKFNIDLYDLIREAIPLLDEAVRKYKLLIGSFEIECENESVKKLLDEFKDTVRVNQFQYGIEQFMGQMVDSAISKGFAVGELVYNQTITDIEFLKVARSNGFRFVKKDNIIKLGQVNDLGNVQVYDYDEDIYYLAFDCREGHPQGYSMFYSLPFVGEIFVRIMQSIRNTIWRVGDPSFLVTVTSSDKAGANKCAQDLKESITDTFVSRKTGKTRDVYASGPADAKIEVKVLGAEKDLINLEIPLRSIEEQIVSVTGFPPFMFALYKWSSTERMSKQQNDMIVSTINSYRQMLEPMLIDILEKKLIVSKINVPFTIKWNKVNLMDEKELADTDKSRAETRKLDYERIAQMFFDGAINDQTYQEELVRAGLIEQKATGDILTRIIHNIKMARSQKLVEMLDREK